MSYYDDIDPRIIRAAKLVYERDKAPPFVCLADWAVSYEAILEEVIQTAEILRAAGKIK
jgi:hypothetical protein